nr:hypothetical protein [Tanacetum cinerariifolium]
TMADNRTMAKLLRAPTERCAEAIVVPPILAEQFELKHNTFYNALNPIDQDSLNAAAGGNLFEKSPQDALTIIKNKSKVCTSRSKPIASPVKACDINSNSEIAKLTHAVNRKTSAMTTAMTAILKQLQATPPPAPVKAVEEICVTCGAACNYNQGNLGYRAQGVANQMRPPGFAQPDVQNNQNRFDQPQGFNRGTNFNQEQPYQATAQPNQNFHLNELEKIKRMNDVIMKAMQNQIDMGELKAITTRSGLVTDGPTVLTPPKSITPEVGEYVEETYTNPDLGEYTIKVSPPPVQKYKPSS